MIKKVGVSKKKVNMCKCMFTFFVDITRRNFSGRYVSCLLFLLLEQSCYE